MANLIASGTTLLDSAEFTLTATDSVNLSLMAPAGSNPVARVMLKGSDSNFIEVGRLTASAPAQVLSGAGTYKVTRLANDVAFGVDKN